MGARTKLNSAYLMGNFILALLAGGATGSVLVGLVTFFLGVACSFSKGEIRPTSQGPPTKKATRSPASRHRR
jgi:hypothetical protein